MPGWPPSRWRRSAGRAVGCDASAPGSTARWPARYALQLRSVSARLSRAAPACRPVTQPRPAQLGAWVQPPEACSARRLSPRLSLARMLALRLRSTRSSRWVTEVASSRRVEHTRNCRMHLVAIAWLYVVVLMALAEATSHQRHAAGRGLHLPALRRAAAGASCCTCWARRRGAARAGAELPSASAPAAAADPDGGGHAPGDAVAPEREEP